MESSTFNPKDFGFIETYTLGDYVMRHVDTQWRIDHKSFGNVCAADYDKIHDVKGLIEIIEVTAEFSEVIRGNTHNASVYSDLIELLKVGDRHNKLGNLGIV